MARKCNFANQRGIEYLNQSTGRDGDEMKMDHLLIRCSNLIIFQHLIFNLFTRTEQTHTLHVVLLRAYMREHTHARQHTHPMTYEGNARL